jgi:hypothetical protein
LWRLLRFFTLFSRALPFDIVGRLWDRYFLEGEVFLFRAALGTPHLRSPTTPSHHRLLTPKELNVSVWLQPS